jgi:hypothetical protein
MALTVNLLTALSGKPFGVSEDAVGLAADQQRSQRASITPSLCAPQTV